MKFILPPRLFVAFLVALLALGANAFLAFHALSGLRQSEVQARRTQEVLVTLESVLSAARDAETGLRGYLLTGNDTYLTPYTTALRATEAQMAQLEALLAGEPDSQGLLTELNNRLAEKTSFMDLAAQVRRDEGEEAAEDLIATGAGKRAMDLIRAAIGRLGEATRARLEVQQETLDDNVRWVRATLGLFTLVSLGLLVLIYLLVRRDLIERIRLSEALQGTNRQLEERVRARTAELAMTNVELRKENEERRRVEQRLEASLRELERSNQELQRFAYVASHDLQEPLRKIRVFVDLFQEDHASGLSPEARKYLERMASAADRMSRLINDLLTFSRVASAPRTTAPVNLNTVVAEVLSDLEVTVLEEKADVTVGLLPTLEGDATQMHQLFQNLVGNALKFRHPERAAQVRIQGEVVEDEERGRLARLTVADNGIGLDPKYTDRIFEPFQRLHGRDSYSGTGIGLSICRRIVERHGGTIAVESTPGEGTTFTILLPVKQPAPTTAAPREVNR